MNHSVIKSKTIRILPFLLLVCSMYFHTSGQVLNQPKLASEYFGNDSSWYLKNIPFFECSDSLLQRIYYYRWELYKAHIREIGNDRYVITEFLNNVSWDIDPYSSLNDATGFHIYEGRWLRNHQYVKGYIDYMFRGGGNDRHFSEAITQAAYAAYLVDGNKNFITDQLGVMQHIYNLWIDHYDSKKSLYYIEPIYDATEYTISSVDASGGKDGFFGGKAFRPTINSYMYGNAQAIAKIAQLKGDSITSKRYFKLAEALKDTMQAKLWNPKFQYFTDRYKSHNKYVHYWDFIRGRELAGIVPWCYNLPDDQAKYTAAWKTLLDTTRLLGKYGLRTVEPSYEYYMKQYRYDYGKRECQWNGPSWPFQTTQALKAMANLLNNYTQQTVSISDYLSLLRLYSKQHYLNDSTIDLEEDYDPDKGGPIVGLPRSHHYNHSGYDDLIITGLCGIHPQSGDSLTIRPLINQSINYFCLENLVYHGHLLSVIYDRTGEKYHQGKGLQVFVDGQKANISKEKQFYHLKVGAPIVGTVKKQAVNLALNVPLKGYPLPSASINNNKDSLYDAIDGRCWYFKEIKNWWSATGTTSNKEWFALDFGKTVSISKIVIALVDDEQRYFTPSDYQIEYWNDTKWVNVKSLKREPLRPTGNTENTVFIHPIQTSKIKITFTNKKRNFAISELKVY